MTGFQLIALLLFVVLAVAAYGKDIYAWLKAKVPAVALPVVPRPAPAESSKEVVDDLLIVAAMRERFLAERCKDGVDACSLLLKIIIDHTHPHAG
jgi:hypothetical protein